MAKIFITENDIKYMAVKVAHKIYETIRYGNAMGSGTWEPMEDLVKLGYDGDEVDAMMRDGRLPLEPTYEISAQQSCTSYSGEDGPGNVSDCSGDKNYGGDYDMAISDINNIPDETLKQTVLSCLEEFCDGLNMDGFEDADPYDELAADDKRYDMQEDLNEHDPDDRDYGQVGDWHVSQGQKALSRGRTFRSKEDFETTARRCELPMCSTQVYLTHNDIGLLDKMVMIEYWPESIYFEAPDHSVGASFGGWVIENVDWEYGPEETCSYEGKIQPLKRGMIGWLDNAVENYNEEKLDKIIDLLYQ